MNTNRKSKAIQEKFNSTLKIFTGKIEETKQKQQEILENFERVQGKENQELVKIFQQINPKEEIMTIVQNAINLVNQQILSRDEAIAIQKVEIKSNEETIKSLLENHRDYINRVHKEID